jgi:hypothetical protein
MIRILAAYLVGGSSVDKDRSAALLAELVVEKAMSGHFGYFKLVIDMVDGKLHRTAVDEMTFETSCVLFGADDGRDAEPAKAA